MTPADYHNDLELSNLGLLLAPNELDLKFDFSPHYVEIDPDKTTDPAAISALLDKAASHFPEAVIGLRMPLGPQAADLVTAWAQIGRRDHPLDGG